MIIKPRVRNFICLTAHPVGCAAGVAEEIAYIRRQAPFKTGSRALIIGSSTGYGLASRITLAFGGGADTLGIMFERPAAGKRTASSGFYNDRAFLEAARAVGQKAFTINKDAFSPDCKAEALDLVRGEFGQVDTVIYSLAAPRRTDAAGQVWNSVIKPIGETYTGKSLDLSDNSIKTVTLEPADEAEIEATIKVMGGEDWYDWIKALDDAKLLAPGATTLAYSYIGPDSTAAIYRDGTIGRAKEDLYQTAAKLRQDFADSGLKAAVSVNKALVTQSSAAIPSVSLYISVLYKKMKERGTHEGCIEQMYRLFSERLPEGGPVTDDRHLIRLDDWEMATDLQQEIAELWPDLSTENITQLGDIGGYWEDFYRIFGFGVKGVDYEADVPTDLL